MKERSEAQQASIAEPLPCPEHIKRRPVFRSKGNYCTYIQKHPDNATPGTFIGACGDMWGEFTPEQQAHITMASIMTKRVEVAHDVYLWSDGDISVLDTKEKR